MERVSLLTYTFFVIIISLNVISGIIHYTERRGGGQRHIQGNYTSPFVPPCVTENGVGCGGVGV